MLVKVIFFPLKPYLTKRCIWQLHKLGSIYHFTLYKLIVYLAAVFFFFLLNLCHRSACCLHVNICFGQAFHLNIWSMNNALCCMS